MEKPDLSLEAVAVDMLLSISAIMMKMARPVAVQYGFLYGCYTENVVLAGIHRL